jgi:hypothetical protein
MPDLSSVVLLRRTIAGHNPEDEYEELPGRFRPTIIRSTGRSVPSSAFAPERSSTSTTMRLIATTLTRSLTSSDRIRWEGRVYEISAINILPRTDRQVELVLNGI